MSPNFDSLYLWKNSSPPLCVIHIQKRLDLLFCPVFPKFGLCCENYTQIAETYRFSQIITILGLIPIVNEVISRCCSLWSIFFWSDKHLFLQHSKILGRLEFWSSWLSATGLGSVKDSITVSLFVLYYFTSDLTNRIGYKTQKQLDWVGLALGLWIACGWG